MQNQNDKNMPDGKERNHFKDNTFDIKSIEDLGPSDTMQVLAKKGGKDIMFELKGDFFHFKDNQLTQYPDFVSLKNSKKGINASQTDYGYSILKNLDVNQDILKVNDFSLEERDAYIKSQLKSGFLTVPFGKVEGQQKKIAQQFKVKENTKEVQDVVHITNAVVDTMALFYAFFKASVVAQRKHMMSQNALMNLSRPGISDLFRTNSDMLKQIPELGQVFKKLDDFNHSLRFDDNFKKMSELERINELISFAINEKDISGTLEKIPETPFFKTNIENINNELEELNKLLSDKLPGLSEKLLENKEQNLASMQTLFSGTAENRAKFDELITKDLKIDPKNKKSQTEFILANNYFASLLKEGEKSTSYEISMMRFLQNPQDIKGTNAENVSWIISKMAEKILDLTSSVTKKNTEQSTLKK